MITLQISARTTAFLYHTLCRMGEIYIRGKYVNLCSNNNFSRIKYFWLRQELKESQSVSNCPSLCEFSYILSILHLSILGLSQVSQLIL